MRSLQSLIRRPREGLLFAWLLFAGVLSAAEPPVQDTISEPPPNFAGLRSAVSDLVATFGARYPGGADFLKQLGELERNTALPPDERQRQFRALQREALLANPLLDFERLLVVRRVSRPPRPR